MAYWDKLTSRGNVEDRRSNTSRTVGGISIAGVVLVVAFNLLSGGDAVDILNQLQTLPTENQQVENTNEFAGEDDYEVFASTVLGSNNDMWERVFTSSNTVYTPPTLVLFRSATESGCGYASSEVGPHYCPADSTIYLDETFFDELNTRLGAKGGDVAEAYVIAHEAAHHAQNLLGITDKVMSEREYNPDSSNELSVSLELQADCYAGAWANSIKDKGIFLPGEIDEALDAAAAVGDDRIQETVNGSINPETWTHGSSKQRVGWFNKGFESGDISSCNTFN